MKTSTLCLAKDAASKFLTAVIEFEKSNPSLYTNDDTSAFSGRQTANIKRKSMDLSRLLADLRQNR